jgi:aminoglycoside 3'-phosphotransferase-2
VPVRTTTTTTTTTTIAAAASSMPVSDRLLLATNMRTRHADPVDLVSSLLTTAGLEASAADVRIVGHGESGDLVALVGGPTPAVVKLAPPELPLNQRALHREVDVLRWLAPIARVPKVLWTGEHLGLDGWTALVMERLPGEPMSHVPPEQAEPALVATIRALAELHAIDLAGCPFDARLPTRLAWAEANVEAGVVDEDDFDEERLGFSAARVLEEVRRTCPADEDLVLAHGDACLPNFLWSGGDADGLIDLGRFGVADRHQDLALFLRSARHNHPHVDLAALLEAHYPLAAVDEARCAFYRLLDELL